MAVAVDIALASLAAAATVAAAAEEEDDTAFSCDSFSRAARKATCTSGSMVPASCSLTIEART
jgi:hypothetical protein